MVEEVSGNGGLGGGTDEKVTAGHGGAVSRYTTIAAGKVPAANLPAQGVWLISVFAGVQGAPQIIDAAADTVLGDGTQKTVAGGAATTLTARSDGIVNNRRATLLRFSLPAFQPADLQNVLLTLTASTISSANPTQIHVYGLNDDSWSEASATWATVTSALKQNVAAGKQIAHNVVANQGTTTKILGQLWASSTTNTELAVDVTSFVREQADGAVSFLLVQDHRWDNTLDSTTSQTVGDTQLDGIKIVSREAGTVSVPGPRLRFFAANTAPVAPTITSQPSSQTITLGGAVSFSVTAAGTAPLSYRWNKNGIDLSGATSPGYLIASAALSDAGNYTVLVTNVAGSVTSATATLTVGEVPAITTQPASQTVASGAAVSFNVAATGTATLAYQWKKDGANLAGATTATYTIAAASTTHAGSYTVVVSNSYGTATSNAATLTVTAPPVITSQPANITVNAGQPASFTVAASGTAPLTYQWRKAGTNVAGATAATYSIAATVVGDAGSYNCVVSNPSGSVTSASAILTVNNPLPGLIVVEMESLTVAASSGDALTYKAEAAASAGNFLYISSNAVGDHITFAVPSVAAGTYTVAMIVKKNTDRAKFQLAVSTNLSGPYTNINAPKDEYASSAAYATIGYTAKATFASAGTQYFRFTVTGKNSSSSSYVMAFDKLTLTP